MQYKHTLSSEAPFRHPLARAVAPWRAESVGVARGQVGACCVGDLWRARRGEGKEEGRRGEGREDGRRGEGEGEEGRREEGRRGGGEEGRRGEGGGEEERGVAVEGKEGSGEGSEVVI